MWVGGCVLLLLNILYLYYTIYYINSYITDLKEYRRSVMVMKSVSLNQLPLKRVMASHFCHIQIMQRKSPYITLLRY